MWNIKTAVSRLSYAPSAKDMKVTDVKRGRFSFVPPAGKPVTRQELDKEIVRAGYGIEAVGIAVRGTLAGATLRASGTGQVFTLTGAKVSQLQAATQPGAMLVVSGSWRAGAGGGAIEVERWEAAP